MNRRAYSLITIKRSDDDARTIEGIATTPTADRMGDIVEPLGITFKNPLPLLWQHNSTQPVGKATFAKPTAAGIAFKARIEKVDEPGALKDRLDEAWQSVKLGLVRAVSIGFRSIERAWMDGGGIHFLKSEVLELSLVTIPANAEATITAAKSIDRASRAGRRPPSGKGRFDPEKFGIDAAEEVARVIASVVGPLRQRVAYLEAKNEASQRVTTPSPAPDRVRTTRYRSGTEMVLLRGSRPILRAVRSTTDPPSLHSKDWLLVGRDRGDVRTPERSASRWLGPGFALTMRGRNGGS